jgi:hypothetical protein
MERSLFSANHQVINREVAADAIVEVDRFGEPFALEILPTSAAFQREDLNALMSALSISQANVHHSDEVDSLTIAFAAADRSFGQKRGRLVLQFSDERLVAVYLRVD